MADCPAAEVIEEGLGRGHHPQADFADLVVEDALIGALGLAIGLAYAFAA